jgi:GMP synthase-like glutamine amidotransferase
MKIHYLQHVPYESLGCIEDWIKERGYQVSATKFYENDILPELSDFDFLIIMGGPMGIYDDHKYQWLKEEKYFIKKAINGNKIILGICLGSQLIADALGSRVYPNKSKEIGWFPVKIINKHKVFNNIPGEIKAAHWHGDTFDLPRGAVHIAESAGCRNQAFILNERVIGLQFHLEFTEDSFKELIKNGKDELIKDKYVQTEQEILRNLNLLRTTNSFLYRILDYLIDV